MKEIIVTIIFILLILTAIASAYAQEAWYEAAESSCAGYRVDSTTSKEIEEVKLDEEISRKMEHIPSKSSFSVRKFTTASGGVWGEALPQPPQ